MPRIHPCGPLLAAILLAACGGGASGVDASGTLVGSEAQKPGGGTFFVDAHQGGTAGELRLVELAWGRLVDVHDLGADGLPGREPVYRDLVVDPGLLSNGVDYELSTNPLTQRTRLVILRERGAPAVGGTTFESLLRDARTRLFPLLPKHDDGSSAPPFSMMPRNAALTLRFDDLLDDRAEVAEDLARLVQVATGYRPTDPFEARLAFDPNFGGLAGGRFHSTRVLIDTTVSPQEASGAPSPVAVNAVGLPPSDRFLDGPNVALRLPTQTDFGSGLFRVLTNLGGRPLGQQTNAPVDHGQPSRPVVRAFRSGNATDVNRGFLFDLHRPELLGAFPAQLLNARDEPSGRPGFDFLVDLGFTSDCRVTPRRGDVIDLNGAFLEVAAQAAAPDNAGIVRDVRASLQALEPLPAASLPGQVRLTTPFLASQSIDPACWVQLDPAPSLPPDGGVSSDVQVLARFSEPMLPTSFGAFETLRLVRGFGDGQVAAEDIVVASLSSSTDLTAFRLRPVLPLDTTLGGEYFVELVAGPGGLTDLAGNPLQVVPPRVDFRLDPDAPTVRNGGFALSFSSNDEVGPLGQPDLRGQVLLDEEDGVLRPRTVSFGSVPADRGNPIPAIMSPFAPGLQTPLSALGSKMQTVWRYCDLGWRLADETRHNVDVTGMAWSPIGGMVIADFFERFEIRLSHSQQLPDEFGTAANGPSLPNSGLFPDPFPYADNVLIGTEQKVVHPRELGYLINPADVYTNANGTAMMPFPLNRGGGPLVTYTWRDTGILSVGGDSGVGVPILRETRSPTIIEPEPGSYAPPGSVPTIGLPLLWEVRCFPTSGGLGLNPLDVSVALHRYCRPVFRVFSTGGFDTSQQPVSKDPDTETVPTGGFNPSSTPPGRPTALNADPLYYIGQLDIVIRVSRAHTMWFDTRITAPRYASAVVEPAPSQQPPGTSVVVEFRGADGFTGDPSAPFDASRLNPYGDPFDGTVLHANGVNAWSEDLTALDGARYCQVRLSFFSNIQTGQSPELSSLGFAFSDGP